MPQNNRPQNDNWFSCWVIRIDDAIEEFDFRFNRTNGGGLTWLNRRIQPFCGHSIFGSVIFLVLLVFLTFGPSFRIHQVSAFLALAGVFVLHLGLAKLAGPRLTLFRVQFLSVTSMYCFRTIPRTASGERFACLTPTPSAWARTPMA